MNDQTIPQQKRFIADSAYVFDTATGQRHFGRRVFDIDGAEFDEVNLSPSDRAQIQSDLGLEGCVGVLQRAFDAQDKPYNARAVVESLVKARFTKKNRWR